MEPISRAFLLLVEKDESPDFSFCADIMAGVCKEDLAARVRSMFAPANDDAYPATCVQHAATSRTRSMLLSLLPLTWLEEEVESKKSPRLIKRASSPHSHKIVYSVVETPEKRRIGMMEPSADDGPTTMRRAGSVSGVREESCSL
jgi:hypothetical protein